ncbi:hypothetical protein R3P93_22490 [Rhodococcus cerastii]|uniref:Uncharacterized protein n=1 Tax=Rhodococcus cerastii TaxID=908616 RepID=A0ABU4D6L4_9NOCA|nr:hypothetical protein [Rhodococcus cerastii]MDV6305343.1 hypothetical protein [Rhodococcus cerastii]
MSSPVNSPAPEPFDQLIDGRSGTRLRSRRRRMDSLAGLIAQPLWMLSALAAGLVTVQAVATIGEYAFLRSSLDHILPDQPSRLLMMIAVGMLVAYSVLCSVVGHRLAVAKEATDDGTEKSSGWRAFGPVGALFLLVAVSALIFMAWRRADVLADRAAAATVAKAQAGADLLGAQTAPTADLDAIRDQAYQSAWWSDFWFVTGVMVLLGAVSVAVGLGMHLVMRAWNIAAVQARADRWIAKAGRADTARNAAQDALRTRVAMREDRSELAQNHRAAVTQRFDNARAHARVYLAQRLGSPDATTNIVPSPADIAAIEKSRP